MDRVSTIEEAPTAVPSPKFPSDSSEKNGKGSSTGVAITATNTIDTLTLDNEKQDTQAADRDEQDEPSGLANTSTARKLALLAMFTLAEFLDAFNNSALFPAIPIISTELKFETTETVWIISAYQLTFAAFLLVVSTLVYGTVVFVILAYILPNLYFSSSTNSLTELPSPERSDIRCVYP